MKYIRTVLPLTLTLLLAACGGDGPTPTPPVDPAPPTAPAPPTTPAPPVTPPTEPAPPTQPPTTPDVPFYGEWAWSFVLNEGCCNEEGRFSIVQVLENTPAGSGFGFYQECYGANCYDDLEGGVVFGPNDDNELAIMMFVLNSANDAVVVYEAVDSDGELTEDEQGRSVFEGKATYYNPNYDDTERGTFKAILTDLPVAFPPTE